MAAEIALQQAAEAMAASDFSAATALLEEAISVAPDLAPAHELLGGLIICALDDHPRARRHLEHAYREYRRVGDLPGAARSAITLGQLDAIIGNQPGVRGWLARAKRLLAEIGPCVEEGYYRIARLGCEVPDVAELEASAERALEVARAFADPNLEVRALAESGLALISLGRTREGLDRLDEALTAVISGEIYDLRTSGLTCCAVITACERLGDLDRVTHLFHSLRRMTDERYNGFQPPILTSHCCQAYGAMLCEAGRWQEAETELRRALAISHAAGHNAAAAGRLAELRIQQNRLPEAAELVAGWEDRLEVAAALARLHDARDELELAASTLRRALRQQEANLVSSAPLLAHLVEVEARRGEQAAADVAATRLEAIAGTLASPTVGALALLSRGRVQTARGEDGEASLRAALTVLGDDQRPRLRGEIHLALAEGKRDLDPAAATVEARAGLAIFERLGSRRDVDRAAALLRSLGVSVRTGASTHAGPGLDQLSRREREVVPLLAEGLSNAEIAQRLFVTSKTVEHHVTSILGKLGLRSRAEVAAWATRRAAPVG
jgi:DNA-binding CsgD family transcriptional regulator/tetratricopeptide (TPR) repeat protein